MPVFGLFGSSYVARLDDFCGGDMHVPGQCVFQGRGGLQASTVTHTMVKKMTAARPNFIFLAIGGNDISVLSTAADIFEDICKLVKTFKEAGVQEVFISEILPRADFSKSKPPGLTKARFDRQRKAINGVLRERYGDRLIKFTDLRCPRDYDDDLVHLSEGGLRKYFFRIRLLFCSL